MKFSSFNEFNSWFHIGSGTYNFGLFSHPFVLLVGCHMAYCRMDGSNRVGRKFASALHAFTYRITYQTRPNQKTGCLLGQRTKLSINRPIDCPSLEKDCSWTNSMMKLSRTDVIETVQYVNNSFREEVTSEVQSASFLQQFKRMTQTTVIKFEQVLIVNHLVNFN